MAFDYQGKRATEAVLPLTEAEQTFQFEGVTEAVVPSAGAASARQCI